MNYRLTILPARRGPRRTLPVGGGAGLILILMMALDVQAGDREFEAIGRRYVDEVPALSPVGATGLAGC